MKYCACLTFVLLAAGCGYWGRRPVDEWTAINRDDPVWIWTNGAVEKWHWVFITQDSVSGIPWKSEMAAGHWCTLCRRSIPRARVDSMKLGYKTHAQHITEFVGVLGGAIVVEGVVCYLFARGDNQC
jgi:hypothetical protein